MHSNIFVKPPPSKSLKCPQITRLNKCLFYTCVRSLHVDRALRCDMARLCVALLKQLCYTSAKYLGGGRFTALCIRYCIIVSRVLHHRLSQQVGINIYLYCSFPPHILPNIAIQLGRHNIAVLRCISYRINLAKYLNVT